LEAWLAKIIVFKNAKKEIQNEIEKLPDSKEIISPKCCKIRKCPFLVRKSKAKPKDYPPSKKY